MGNSLHISISAEKVFSIGSFDVTNSMLTSVVVSTFIILFALAARSALNPNTSKPSNFQNFVEWMVESFYNLIHGVTQEDKKTWFFMPYIMGFFIFILLNNWFGLLPFVGTVGVTQEVISQEGAEHSSLSLVDPVFASDSTQEDHAEDTPKVEHYDENTSGSDEHSETADHSAETHTKFVPLFRATTADLNATLALAIVSVFITQVIGFRYLKFSYFKKYINFSNPINFFVGILEIISEFAKIISFGFRLFGNIFAGEVLLVVISFLAALIVPIPFYALEIFVGFIQALVFSLLSLVFFNMATESHDEH